MSNKWLEVGSLVVGHTAVDFGGLVRVHDDERQLDRGIGGGHHALALVPLVPLDQSLERHMLHDHFAQHFVFLLDALAAQTVFLLQGQKLLRKGGKGKIIPLVFQMCSGECQSHLGRIRGQPYPADLLLVLGDNIDCHQHVERIVDTTSDILLITVVVVRIVLHLLADQVVGHLVVGGLALLLHLLADLHREVAQPLAGLVRLAFPLYGR